MKDVRIELDVDVVRRDGGGLSVYVEFYPNILYALRSLHDSERRSAWNPLQNCGLPRFFAMADTGLLYPANLLFFVLDGARALRGV